jgi:transketolase
MFAAHHRLGNLFVIIDNNGQQAFGYTKDVLDLSPLAERWQGFGWDAVAVDGHDQDQMFDTISSAAARPYVPHVIVANTVFGEGVSFMRNQIKWHYSPLSDDQYAQACRELEGAL